MRSIAHNLMMMASTQTIVSGQAAYTFPGTYSWTCPAGVFSVCVVCIGAGGNGGSTSSMPGGEGGGLGYKNNIAVTPGNSYTVVVAGPVSNASVETSYFLSTATVSAKGGAGGNSASVGSRTTGCGTYVGDGGGLGGFTNGISTNGHAGCGAAGYSGNGGNANNNTDGSPGSGGGGGAGADGGGASSSRGGGGGGVGILGEGANGAGGTGTGGGGGGGSGGGDGSSGLAGGDGGLYGGGGGQRSDGNPGDGASGAVRIIWGVGRAFPSTNTADV